MTAFEQSFGLRIKKRLFGILAQGFFKLTHNGAALVGLLVLFTATAMVARPDLRLIGEQQLMGWLQNRQFEILGLQAEPEAIDRTTAANPADLPKPQANVAHWLARKYRIAPEPLSALVAHTWDMSTRLKIDPALILAVMAIESGFNPYAQSSMGAQGLMQVMTKVHLDKYQNFGGPLAAFDPLSNLRVGVRVLQECIARAGSVEGGLQLYVGASSTDASDYVTKVLTEQERIRQVALGQAVPATLAQPANISTTSTNIPKPVVATATAVARAQEAQES